LLSGIVYPILGKYEKAGEEAKKAIEITPDFSIPYATLAFSYEQLNRPADAENTLQQASERKLENPDYLVLRYDLAFLRGDKGAMESAAAAGEGKPEAEEGVIDHEAFASAYSGKLQQATKLAQRAADLAQQAGLHERAAEYETGTALWEASFGNASAAKRSATAVLEQSKDPDVEYGAAFALALSGDSSGSQTLTDDLEERFPEDTSVKFSYLPALRGLFALNHGEPSKAIEALQTAVPYELGVPHSSFLGFFGTFYPVYVRGLSYLAAHQGAEAAAEFQKILDHHGIVVSDPVGALARLQLGRALVVSGDIAKARVAYTDFLTLWKDADPDIPILKEAKAEYAKLQ
jgi:tetratricopeptide (TPR) repeat protein